MSGSINCLLCHGKGGSYVPRLDGGRRWVKCSRCFPKFTLLEAKEQAIRRYVTGNRNSLARDHAGLLGATIGELQTACDKHDAQLRMNT